MGVNLTAQRTGQVYDLLGGYYKHVSRGVSDPQLLSDKIAKAFFDLRMTWYRSLPSILWVIIYVVFFAMTFPRRMRGFK